ncbi:MAG: hypothetical protein KME21_05505 [Desmonostoc vinosum HA7617-LM4]|jgi:hypothetical protein|nr:hypothetical protein [Desmonostoc vinosum HA7617-LM4]
MATFSVTNTNDSGIGSLRQAISDANTLTGGDIINFDGVFADNIARTITLSSSLQITDDVDIQGTDASLISVSGNYSQDLDGSESGSRVFEISSDTTVEIVGLTITKGYYVSIDGASGIFNNGTLTLNNSIVSGNVSQGQGAGIFNSGILTVNNSIISDNSAAFEIVEGGGIYNSGTLTVNKSTFSGNTAGFGGGIFNTGVATIDESTFNSNTSYQIILNVGTITFRNSTFINNNADGYFGGSNVILNVGTATLSNSTVSDNSGGRASFGTIVNEGNFTIADSTISGNDLGQGGAGYINNSGTIAIINSSISDNDFSFSSAGIFNSGILSVTTSTISNNITTNSGINNSGTATIANSTINNNGGENGGGINNSGTLTLNNSTISSNGAARGGGIYNTNNLTVNNSTIAFNSGEGIYNTNPSNPDEEIYDTTSGTNTISGTAVVNNSIIAGNIKDPDTDPVNNDVFGSFVSNGFNLIGTLNGSTGFNASEQLNVPITDVLDTALRDNGGSSRTHALVVGSPAINAGKNADIPADTADLNNNGNITEPVPFDGRGLGFARVVGGRVDIGAYETAVDVIVINGTPGRDFIKGTANNDIITGFQGRDILTGGASADAFVYTSIRDAGDTITDFKTGTDVIVLQKLFSNLGLGFLNYQTAIANGYLRFETKGNSTILSIDPDGSFGRGRAVKFIDFNKVSVTQLKDATNFVF